MLSYGGGHKRSMRRRRVSCLCRRGKTAENKKERCKNVGKTGAV